MKTEQEENKVLDLVPEIEEYANFDGLESVAVGMYVIYDRVAKVFSPVFEQANDAAAKRVFTLKSLKDMPQEADKSDFALFKVGQRRGVDITSEGYKILQVGVYET